MCDWGTGSLEAVGQKGLPALQLQKDPWEKYALLTCDISSKPVYGPRNEGRRKRTRVRAIAVKIIVSFYRAELARARIDNRRGLKPEPKPPERRSSTQRGTQQSCYCF